MTVGPRKSVNFVLSILWIAISTVYLLIILYKINHEVEIDAEVWHQLELNRSNSPLELEQRQYLTLVMFQQTGIVLMLFLIPLGFSLSRNRAVLKRHHKRLTKVFKEQEKSEKRSFSEKLIAIYSNLTANDLTLCEMLYSRLSSKEIAGRLNITPSSVNTARYRLRKKMKVPPNVELTTFLQKIQAT